MITIVTGAPGHGKSYTAVKMIDEFIHDGKFVVTNVPLRKDFSEKMAKHHVLFSRFRKKALKRCELRYIERVHVCTDLADIMRVRFEGKGEGRGKIVIDESHRVMNVRGATRATKGVAGEEAKKRKEVVAYVSAHRHYGADVILITQAIQNLDLQIRNLMEFHSEVRNFRRLPVFSLFCRLIPGGQLFLRVTVWNDRARTKSGLSMYGLSKSLANLYDTHSLEQGDWPEDAILLPSHPDDRITTVEETLDSSIDEVFTLDDTSEVVASAST